MTSAHTPRRTAFTFSSSGTTEYLEKVDVAAYHCGRITVAELVRRALRCYISSADEFPEEFKKEFLAVDLERELGARTRKRQHNSERKALEQAEIDAARRRGRVV